jgi:hypothetical protein
MHLVRAALSATARGGRSLQATPHQFVPRGVPSWDVRRHGLSTLSSLAFGQQQQQQQVTDATKNKNSLNLHHLRRGNDYVQHQQLRYRRHDRSSAFSKPRPKTKKQRQEYNRRMKKISDETEKHNRPGSRAGPLRQVKKERWQQLLDHGKEADEVLPSVEEEYGLDDFMVEELIGNSAYLTSQPTPEPHYLGHMHAELFHKTATQMELYRRGAEESSADNEILDISIASLPSDKAISDVIRAFRDKHGTRHRPIGIVMALQHVLKDLSIPTAAFGEYTYTSLLTCCRTPNEVSFAHEAFVMDFLWDKVSHFHVGTPDIQAHQRESAPNFFL